MSIRQGSKTIAGMGGSADGETIKNQNTNSSIEKLKMWEGTEEEYQALPVKANDTLYNTTGTGMSFHELLDKMYPVGAIYETSQDIDICPISALIGEWVKEPSIVNDKFVIETYGNSVTGYRIWNDGYCEQWDYVNVNSGITSTNKRVTFAKKFKETPRIFIGQDANAAVLVGSGWQSATEFSIGTFSGQSSTGRVSWKASGYLATDQYTPITIPTYNKFRRIA